MSIFLGDRSATNSAVGFLFTTAVNGVPTDMAGTVTIDIYKRASSTPIFAGLSSVTQTYNGVVGLNFVSLSIGGTFSAGDIMVVLSGSPTLNGVPLAGTVLAHFSVNVGNANTLNAGTISANFAGGTGMMGLAAATVAQGTVTSGGSTTSVPTSALTLANATNADQFKDRTLVFLSTTTTAALRGVAKKITGSTASATPTLTVNALPQAPVSGDTFVIV